MRSLNLADIRASYTEGKREDARKDPWAHYVARPVSFYIALPLANWGVKPVNLVFTGLIIGLGGCFLLSLGHYWTIVLGATLVNINGLLDYVDGDVARATNTVDEYGARWDGINYLTITGLLFMCVGFGLGGFSYLLLGAGASFVRIFRFAVTYQAQLPASPSKPNILTRFGMAVIGVREPLLLMCAISNTLGLFLVFYFVVNVCELSAVLSKLLLREK